MRIRVKDVLEMLAGWASEDQILADYPDLEREDIRACLEYAAQYFDHPVVFGGGYAVSCRRPVAAVVGSETGKGSLRWASDQKLTASHDRPRLATMTPARGGTANSAKGGVSLVSPHQATPLHFTDLLLCSS